MRVLLLCLLLLITNGIAATVPIVNFPLQPYNIRINQVINSHDSKPLLTERYQQQRYQDYLQHTFASNADAYTPWTASYVNKIIGMPINMYAIELRTLNYYAKAKAKILKAYGLNFRPLKKQWFKHVADSFNPAQLTLAHFVAKRRAIIVHNVQGKALPSDEPLFYKFTLPGQGYPFDNLLESSVWSGTPVYVIASTNNKAWDLVITPAQVTWVPHYAVAFAGESFIHRWRKAAQHKLVAITKTKLGINQTGGAAHITGFIGSVFPLLSENQKHYKLLIPVADGSGYAEIKQATINKTGGVIMPLRATAANFAMLMQQLIHRPYGWGGLYFNNDCSQELKSLFTPFGIWLPRQSRAQLDVLQQKNIGGKIHHSQNRINWLERNGKPFLSVIYIGGHIMLYVGNHRFHNQLVPYTYQDLWGMKPKTGKENRAVIGQSLLFPLLPHYSVKGRLYKPETDDKRPFVVGFINTWPEGGAAVARHCFLQHFLKQLQGN